MVLIPFSLNHGLCVNCLNLPYQCCQKLLLGKQCCCSFFFIFFHSSFKETKKLIRLYVKKILNKISVSFGGIWRKSKTRSLFHLWTFVLFFGLRSFFFWVDFLGSTCANAYSRHGCTSSGTWQNFTGELSCHFRSTKRLVLELFSLKWAFLSPKVWIHKDTFMVHSYCISRIEVGNSDKC